MGWTTPDGGPAQVLEIRPGQTNGPCRLRVPPGQGYVVGDIKNAGKTIDFGAQIADFITIKLEGLATRIGQSAVAPFQGCLDAAQPPAAVGGAPPSGIAALPDLPLRSRSAVGDAGTTGTAAAQSWWQQEVEWLPVGGKGSHGQAAEAAPGFEAVESGRRLGPTGLAAVPQAPREAFKTRLVSGKIMAYASPDSTYAVTKKLLDSTHAPSSSASTISAPIT